MCIILPDIISAMHTHLHSRRQHAAPHTQGSVIHWAGAYDALVTLLMLGNASTLRERTVALADLVNGETVLDVGCGTGEITLRAARRVGAQGSVMGLDPSPEMIAVAQGKAAQARLQIDFRMGVIEALPYPDDFFDAVLSSLMMHHLPAELKRAGLQEIARVLKPRGRLVIVDIKRPTRVLEKLSLMIMLHRRLSSGIQDLAPMLRDAGFAAIESGDLKQRSLGYLRASQDPG